MLAHGRAVLYNACKGGAHMLELYDLEKLAAFAREGTLVAASEKLLISQPALSRSMW